MVTVSSGSVHGDVAVGPIYALAVLEVRSSALPIARTSSIVSQTPATSVDVPVVKVVVLEAASAFPEASRASVVTRSLYCVLAVSAEAGVTVNAVPVLVGCPENCTQVLLAKLSEALVSCIVPVQAVLLVLTVTDGEPIVLLKVITIEGLR